MSLTVQNTELTLSRITLALSICPCYEATLVSYNQAVSKVPRHTGAVRLWSNTTLTPSNSNSTLPLSTWNVGGLKLSQEPGLSCEILKYFFFKVPPGKRWDSNLDCTILRHTTTQFGTQMLIFCTHLSTKSHITSSQTVIFILKHREVWRMSN